MSRNLAELFYQTAERFADKKALFYKENGRYRSLTWGEAGMRVRAAAAFLRARGLGKGDRLALLSENRPEWLVLDFAALSLGVVTVPIYTSLSPSEIEYILADSGARMVAVSGKTLFEKLVPIQRNLPGLSGLIVFESAVLAGRSEVSIPVHAFQEIIKSTPASFEEALEADTLASFIYTSGTTGSPKGVMLTHGNFLENARMAKEAFKMDQSEVHLSFLPLSHVFERTCGYYLMVLIGASIAYAENMDSVPKNIREIRPTFLLGVPRFYEKVQARVLEAVKTASPIKKGLFTWARELGRKRRMKEPIGLLNRALLPLADILVYRKFKRGLGGRLRFGVSGGAALAKEIAEFFYDLGILIYEGYGLTETSPVITANREGGWKFGSVGTAFDGVEVKISPEGEILTRSVCVMKGYFNRPAETAEAMADGWFHTGDLGRLDAEGFLFITGRKKELIVTSGGKKVSPRPIEELMEKDPMILRCVLFGEGRRFITAFLVPRRDALVEAANQQKIAFDDYASLLKNKKVYEMLDARVQNTQKDLAPYERIKYFALLENDFGQSSGELTPTLKVKRDVVQARYKELLLPFYVE